MRPLGGNLTVNFHPGLGPTGFFVPLGRPSQQSLERARASIDASFAMELATGRIAGKDSSRGSDSGRGGASGPSSSKRERDLEHRSSGHGGGGGLGGREKGRRGDGRDYSREHDWRSKGDKSQHARRSGESRGGSSRYSKDHDPGYRYLGHRDRSRWVPKSCSLAGAMGLPVTPFGSNPPSTEQDLASCTMLL